MSRYGMLEILKPDCPECNQNTLTYNGNYYCTNCIWALPHPVPAQLRVLYKDMYVSNAELRGVKPDKEVVKEILTGELP